MLTAHRGIRIRRLGLRVSGRELGFICRRVAARADMKKKHGAVLGKWRRGMRASLELCAVRSKQC